MENIKNFLRQDIENGSGYGDGSGYGNGDGSGYGNGDGSGYGNGDGSGYGNGCGNGSGYGNGDGSGYGNGCGNGSGYGNGDGSGYGYGCGNGSGYGNGDGSGYGNGCGNGSGYGNGDGSGYGRGYGRGYIKKINNKDVHIIDDVQTILLSVHNNVAKGYILNFDLTFTPCYVVKGHGYFAHGKTIKEAIEALEDKIFDDMDVEEKIEEFIKEFDLSKKYTGKKFYEWHHKLTGSCEMGRNIFVANHGIDLKKKFTVKEFIEMTKGDYGGSVIKQLAEKIGE